ncbi:RluA family pseudouridine synthase [Buchnera aphidicola]|uniref:RluA family pseudouridine synthase n=1 Tax=Buchnera aphidicola TaxID=9 RepID=UPI003464A303
MKNKILPISHIYINEDMINQRIDNFLIKKYKNIPKSVIYRIIRTGQVRINKRRIKQYYKLNIGDKLRIPPILIEKQKQNFINKNSFPDLSKNIIYEDNYLLIINKPSGIAVHGGSGLNFGVIEYFRYIRPLNGFLELVHRIDRDTSGILILSKKRISLCHLHKQFREKKIKKEYIALVHGKWPLDIKKISAPLLKIQSINHPKKVVIHKNGKYSETYFNIKRRYCATTLMHIIPKTGRTHQIRAHALHAGHPIVFDNRYGKNNLDINIKKITNINRLLLHSFKMFFIHPSDGKKMHIIAPLDAQFEKFLNILPEF